MSLCGIIKYTCVDAVILVVNNILFWLFILAKSYVDSIDSNWNILIQEGILISLFKIFIVIRYLGTATVLKIHPSTQHSKFLYGRH